MLEPSAHRKPRIGISACLTGHNVRYNGGHKASGYGRDMSKYVLEEYTNTKHVMIRHGD